MKIKRWGIVFLLLTLQCTSSLDESDTDLSARLSLSTEGDEDTSEVLPENFKMAFFGDQGNNENAGAVLDLIRQEGANAVVHLGDFDYAGDPEAWDRMISDHLDSDFPYFSLIGNHDEEAWDAAIGGREGYQKKIEDRFRRLSLNWTGHLGLKSSFKYNGLFFVFTAPGTYPTALVWERTLGAETFIRDQLASNHSIWKICAWHKNMHAMQAGDMPDETGWEVYEECRKGGAIIATAHEHSYQRTKTLVDIPTQAVHPRLPPHRLLVGGGFTFVFVSGLGGESIHRQGRCLPEALRPQDQCKDEWAVIYTANQEAAFGALFIVFGVDGDPRKAQGSFKNIRGKIVDSFEITSKN